MAGAEQGRAAGAAPEGLGAAAPEGPGAATAGGSGAAAGAGADASAGGPAADPGAEARRLMRAADAATLATARDGQPFAGLVTPAVEADGAVLLLLSELSEHTRQLRDDGRCALLFAGPPVEQNPQTAPRVTVTGLAAPIPRADDAPARRRFLARHPYAALYAGFGDFALWRVRPGGALLVGGFARATRLRTAGLAPDPAAVRALAEAEAEVLAHLDGDHPDALAAIATGLLGGAPGAWRAAALDLDGLDLACGERVLRLHFPAPVRDAGGVRAALVAAARDARARPAIAAPPPSSQVQQSP